MTVEETHEYNMRAGWGGKMVIKKQRKEASTKQERQRQRQNKVKTKRQHREKDKTRQREIQNQYTTEEVGRAEGGGHYEPRGSGERWRGHR
jgi:hypothetical protein